MSNTNANATEDLLPDNNTNVNPTSIHLEARALGEMLMVHDDIDKEDDTYNDKNNLKKYFRKWSGQHQSNETSIQIFECLLTFVGTIISLGIISAVHYRILAKYDLTFLIGSFGASALLLFGVPSSPLSQPRNAICGQVIGATVGCIVRLIFTYINEKFIAATISVALSILIMQLTKTLHAPGGATALNIIMTTTTFPWYGFQYILMPTLSGTIISLIVAVIINNLSPKRHYPLSWW